MAHPRRFWLLKTEPISFSIQDLAASPHQTTCWDGVRNFQARNFIRDQMHVGDRVLLHHSNADPPAVVGTAVIVREAYPDHTAWDPNHEHYDSKASPQNALWQMVDIKLEQIFPHPASLDQLREIPPLAKMELLRKGSRLSVQPVTAEEFETIVQFAGGTMQPPPPAKKTPTPDTLAAPSKSPSKQIKKSSAAKSAPRAKPPTKKSSQPKPAKGK
jgi:predicted RNA-binding protein with PUA-like domain